MAGVAPTHGIPARGTGTAARKGWIAAGNGTFGRNQKGNGMKLIDMFKAFVRDEEGAAAVEYGLIAALIAGTIVANVDTIGNRLNTAFGNLLTAMTTGGLP